MTQKFLLSIETLLEYLLLKIKLHSNTENRSWMLYCNSSQHSK